MKKADVILALTEQCVDIPEGMGYNDLCKLLKAHMDGDTPTDAAPTRTIKLTNKIPKRNMFLADAVRNERDTEVLNQELRKREHKGKVLRTTTVKEYEVIDGHWVTNFVIELKE